MRCLNSYLKYSFSNYHNQLRLWRFLNHTIAINRFYCVSKHDDLIHNPDVQRYLRQLQAEHNAKDNMKQSVVLNPVASLLDERATAQDELKILESLIEDNDKEMKKLAVEEQTMFLKKINELDHKLISELLPVNTQPNRDIILEVTAGVGGKEAMLFAGELFQMYSQYASHKRWEWSLAEVDTSEGGGMRHGSAFISGQSAYSSLMQEVGAHRVQRVPETEKSGRIHTSTVVVSVLVQPTEVEVTLKDKDLKIETKTSSGAGGQHVNKTESCVRITHLPTGIVIENQTERSQLQNKSKAMQRLRIKLYKMELDGQISKSRATKKEQVGSGERNEKIRTYNFNQDRITDHRSSTTLHNLATFLSGGRDLDELIQMLIERQQRQQFLQLIADQLPHSK